MPQDYDKKTKVEEARAAISAERARERLSSPNLRPQDVLDILKDEVGRLEEEMATYRVTDDEIFS